jgi:DHA3 family macrolide efflux protein-like MFS transporter
VDLRVVFVSQSIANGALRTNMKAIIEPQYQGWVLTLVSGVAGAMPAVGLAIAGQLSNWLGIQTWFIIGGSACLAMRMLMLIIPAVVNVESCER